MVPGPIAAAAAGLFGGLSRLRGARIFHPKGVGFDAELSVDAAHHEYEGVPMLTRPARHPAIVRLSYALGLPDRWPDMLGLAVRLADFHGPGRHQDFLLITSAAGPLRWIFLPAPRGFRGHTYSSLLPYRLGAELRMVGARAVPKGRPAAGGALADVLHVADRGKLEFELCLARLAGPWEGVARLSIGERLDDAYVERLAFNPWHTGGGMRPVGPLMRLRKPAYAGSQRGRGVNPGRVGPWP